MSLKPHVVLKVAESLEDIYSALIAIGLTHDDIVILIQRRCKNKVGKREIELVMNAIRDIESSLRKAVIE